MDENVLNDQESCVINGGITTQSFKLEKGGRQSDPVSAYLFILCLEILFTIVKNNKDYKNLNIFGNTFLMQICRWHDFFLEKIGFKELLNTITLFSSFSALKSNLSNREVAGMGLLKV